VDEEYHPENSVHPVNLERRLCVKPRIDKTNFGSITIAGEKFEHDVILRLDGRVEKRKKKLSKEIYGTSHVVSLAEAEFVFEAGAARLIVGAGQSGMLELSDEAADFFKKKKCAVELFPTPKAIQRWNKAEGPAIGLFHVTC
jgi:hypothetical protein